MSRISDILLHDCWGIEKVSTYARPLLSTEFVDEILTLFDALAACARAQSDDDLAKHYDHACVVRDSIVVDHEGEMVSEQETESTAIEQYVGCQAMAIIDQAFIVFSRDLRRADHIQAFADEFLWRNFRTGMTNFWYLLLMLSIDVAKDQPLMRVEIHDRIEQFADLEWASHNPKLRETAYTNLVAAMAETW